MNRLVGELVEAFEKVEPENLWGETPFTGKHYTYLGNGDLQLKNSQDGVREDTYEVLEKGGGRLYALVKAIVGLAEEVLKKYWVKHCYMFSQDYGGILRRMWEIMGGNNGLFPRILRC